MGYCGWVWVTVVWVTVQANALTCIEKIIDKLEKTDILDEVMPMLAKAKIQDPAILMPVVRHETTPILLDILSRLFEITSQFFA
ncbi:hypothetical protein CEXT_570501 [Caerostris extrusa]|uniref:Uncharacterized protein n=1 Tax=Caerostris extrusa TaxID=172846 RepID=A0AAV4TSY4_CAEEX|nr:hypothetical protein CEXT_570501 [Caerostris extrusa]